MHFFQPNLLGVYCNSQQTSVHTIFSKLPWPCHVNRQNCFNTQGFCVWNHAIVLLNSCLQGCLLLTDFSADPGTTLIPIVISVETLRSPFQTCHQHFNLVGQGVLLIFICCCCGSNITTIYINNSSPSKIPFRVLQGTMRENNKQRHRNTVSKAYITLSASRNMRKRTMTPKLLSAHSFTSLIQSSNWPSATENCIFIVSRFCCWLCRALMVYSEKE